MRITLRTDFPPQGGISGNPFILTTFGSVQSLRRVRLFATPWTAACQASFSIANSKSLLKFMPIESVMPSNHLILCFPLLLPPSIFPSIRVFSNESALHIRLRVFQTLMLGKIEHKRRKGWQRMRWLDSITDSMGMNLSKLWEIVEEGEDWCAIVHVVTRSQTQLSD